MKSILTFLFCANCIFWCDAQLVVESGATLTMNGSAKLVLNNVDLVNEGTLTTAATSTITFTGSSDNSLDVGGATISNLEMDKSSGAKVTLADDVTVSESLSFGSSENYLVTASSTITLDGDASVTGADSDNYVIANGSGFFNKQFSSASAYTYPVGDATEYSPIEANVTGTLGAAAAVKVNIIDANHPNLPSDASDYISRYWNVIGSDITSYSNTLTGTYVPADLTGTAANVKGASYVSSWSYTDAAAGTNTATGTTTALDADFTASNFFGKANLKVLLQGAQGGGTMTTNLTLPLSSPYTDAPLTVTAIPADVTDWIKLEVRDAATPSTVVSKHSAFLKSDGTIVGAEGTSLPLLKDASPTGYIALYHRNHLPIRTATALDLVNTSLHDFTTGLAQAYDNPSISNDAMMDLGGSFAMFRANVSGDSNLNVLDFFQTKLNTNPSEVGVYSPFDVNMDSNLNVLDFFLAKQSTNPSKSAHL